MWCFCFTVDTLCSGLYNMKIFLFGGSILISKLLKQGFSTQKLETTFINLYGPHTDLIHKFYTSVLHMLKALLSQLTYDWFPAMRINDWFVAWISLTLLSRIYFIRKTKECT